MTRAASLLALLIVTLIAAAVGAPSARALTPAPVNDAADRVNISTKSEFYSSRGDNLQVEMAAVEGVAGRMAVRAVRPGSNPSWMVFALQNTTNKTQVRWIVAERYTIVGSGIIWPDLDARRIEAITPSIGFLPERIETDRADVFRVSLEPGQIVTFAAELAVERPQQLTMWQPLAYQLKLRERQLFNGVLLGIAGLLGVFLTAIFAANHRVIFPAAALVAWCVLAYLCVDFGYWHKLLQIKSEDNAVWRAATEAAMASSLVIFLTMYLRLGAWFSFVRMIAGVWIVASLALVFIAVLDPRLAATFARVSFAAIGAVGALVMLALALGGQDRAIHLAPVWVLFIVWVFGAGMALSGRLTSDIVVPSLTASLVLIVVLMGFVVTQFAFHSPDGLRGGDGDQSIRSLAVEGSGAAVFEWHSRRDEINVEPVVEASLGLGRGELSAKAEHFFGHVHSADRERLRAQLASLKEIASQTFKAQFRLRHADNSYRWFDVEASRVETIDRRGLRYVGLVRDITDDKRAVERLMHDAVHDHLTSLPNRTLFLDRLSVAVARAKGPDISGPAIVFIDIDKFKSVNSSYGLVVGDTLLLTLSRRIGPLLGDGDTLARVGGDQFAILAADDTEPQRLAALAEAARRAIRSPIKIAGQDIVLTCAIGIAVYDGTPSSSADLLREAEIAMYRAKEGGADRIELFTTALRGNRDDRVVIESELRKALETDQIKVLYQPIVHLPTEELAGFEALVRWEHPRLGIRNPNDFVQVAEESDLIVKLGNFVLQRAVAEAQRWQKRVPRTDRPLFVSVNVSSRQLLGSELVKEVRNIQSRGLVPDGVLRLEVTERLVMENPEQSAETMAALRAGGARLALDDFGTGYSSLAYLSRFAVDAIKLDRDMVQGCSGDGPNAVIVRSMIAMAHELGMKVVAEGIEEPEDARFLRSIGCELGQGYYFGEPMGARDVIEMLAAVARTERNLNKRGIFRRKAVSENSATDTEATAKPSSALAAGERTNGWKPAARNSASTPAANGAVRPPDKQVASPPTGASARPSAAQPHSSAQAQAAGAPPLPTPNGGVRPPHAVSLPSSAIGAPGTASAIPPGQSVPPRHSQAAVATTDGHGAAVPKDAKSRPPNMPPSGQSAVSDESLMSQLGALQQQAAQDADRVRDGSEPSGGSVPPRAPGIMDNPSAAMLARIDSMRTLPPGIAESLARLAGMPVEEPSKRETAGVPDKPEGTEGDEDGSGSRTAARQPVSRRA